MTSIREPAGRTSRKGDKAEGSGRDHDHSRVTVERNGCNHTAAVGAEGITERLVERIGRHKYDMWFGDTTRLRVEGTQLEVATDSVFVAEWIGRHFAGDLDGVAHEALGEAAEVNVRVAPEFFGRSSRESRSQPGKHQPLPETGDSGRGEVPPGGSVGTDEQPTPGPEPRNRDQRRISFRRLETYVVGPSNRLAYSAAIRMAEEQNAAASPLLFVHGECGLGKTHLLQGICQRFLDAGGRRRVVRYVTGEQFTNEFIAAVRNNSVDDFRRRMRKVDLLAIDDIHFLSNKVATQSEFLHTLDTIDLSGSRIVLASDEHPRHIKRFSAALVSRFLSGMVVRIERPDRETRFAIIHRLAAARGLRLTDAAAETVVSHCVGSVRELEGAITKLAALHLLLQTTGEAADGEIGQRLVDQLYRDFSTNETAAPVRIGTVIETVCEHLSLERSELIGASRHRKVVLARGLVAYLGREMTTLSYPEIAQALGRNCHSTVHTAAARLRKLLENGEPADIGVEGRVISVKELCDDIRHTATRRSTGRG